MRFEFRFVDGFVIIAYKSSKETICLGSLSFLDSDGDNRDDVRALLLSVLEAEKNPMLDIVRIS